MKKEKKVVKKDEQIEKPEKQKRPLLSKLLIVLLIFVCIYLYARYTGTSGLKVKEYNIINESIPQSFDGFSIVQFSDIELLSTFDYDDIDKMVKKINDLKPDVVVFTGDLAKYKYSPSSKEKKKLIESLSSIDSLIGKYSIRGDDDYIGSLYDEVFPASGFKDITNSYELIYYKGLTPIVLYGLGSINGDTRNIEETFSYESAEGDMYAPSYNILLAHEPDSINDVSSYNISLMLAGHSHNSEINIPYLKTLYHIKGANDYYDEHYKVNDTELYISSGLGTSKYKVRLFNKPSISIFRLYTD